MTGRILVADDQLYVRELLREIVEPEGFEVVADACGPGDAVAAFERLRPDVCVLDVMMPPGSTAEAVRAIRRLEPRARVVLLGARGQETLVMEAIQAGALDWVVKPLQHEAVLEALMAALEKVE